MWSLLVSSIFICTSIAVNCPTSTNVCACTGLSPNDNCVLDCNGRDDCHGDTLTCTTGHPCIVTCIGYDSCFEGTLNANQATYLILNCGIDSGSNDGDCWGLNVDARSTTDVTVHCTDSDGSACNELQLQCGTGNCQINCEGDSCVSVTVDATLASQYTCSGDGCPPSTSVQTSAPTTFTPTTNNPTTSNPTTSFPTTSIPTTSNPTTHNPTTRFPTTATPTTNIPTTTNPTTRSPTTSVPTTISPTTSFPTTLIPTTSIPTVSNTNPKQCDNRYNAMLSVKFDYKNRNNVGSNVITNILHNISNEYIAKISANISSHCVVDYYTKAIDVSNGASNAVINISMCLDCHVEVNTQQLFDKQKLQTDFIIVFESETDVIEVNSTDINVDIIDQEAPTDTTTQIGTSRDNDRGYNNAKNNDLLGNILYIAIGFGATCMLLTCCIVIYNRRQKKYKTDENTMQQNKFAMAQRIQSVDSCSVKNTSQIPLTEMVKHSGDDYIVPGSPQTTDMGIETIDNNTTGVLGDGDPSNDPIIMDDDEDIIDEIETIGNTIQ